MNKFLHSVVAGLVLLPAAALAAKFEGKVTLKATTGKDSFEIIQSIKGDMMRNETSMAKGMGYSIMDMKKLQMFTIMDEMKMYMKMDLGQMAEKTITADDTKVEKTSETEKIAGYTATKYIITSKDGITESWMTEGLGGFAMSSGNPMAGKNSAPPAWVSAFAGKELFPLRVVTKSKVGKETYRMEATSVEKKSLPDSLFAIPDGYKEFSMGNMMKGLIPGFGR